MAGVGLYAFFVAKVQWQTTELGNYQEAEGQWGAVPGQLHHLQVWRRIWGAADPPKSNAEPCRIEGGQDRGRGVLRCVQEKAQGHPCASRPVTGAHVAAIWPACCWGSPPGALLLTGTSAFYSRQRIWERSGLQAGVESQPRRGSSPHPTPHVTACWTPATTVV